MNKQKNDAGALTLEASITTPIFIMLMLIVNGLFIMFMGQQMVSHALVQSAKSLSFDPYSTQYVANANDGLLDMITDLFSLTDNGHSSNEKWYEEGYADFEKIIEERFINYLNVPDTNDDGKNSRTEANKLLKSVGIKNGIDGIDFSGCVVDEGVLTMKIKFTQEYVFNFANLASFDRELSVQVKLFEKGD